MNKLDKLLASLMTKKWVKTQVTKVRNQSGEIYTDFTAIRRVIKEYEKLWCGNTIDSLDEMDKFIETYSLPRLKLEEI